MRFPLAVSVFVCFALITIPLLAQSPNGNINGLVSDPSSAAVIGAEIVAANDVTGVQYTTKTNSEGIYVLPNLPPGPYRLQVSKIGFKTLVKPDIVLNVQDSLSINFTLLVGAFHEVVTVQGGAPLVNTESATVSTVVDRQFAENLPMNGRSFQSLIELTPGVVVTTSTAYDSGQFSVDGQRASSNYWMVDGVSANIGVGAAQFTPGNGIGGTVGSFSALGGTNGLVSVDAMEEFRIQTSTFAPEFGRTPGGQISIVTRSGTNQLHGTAFDYLRNDLFDATDWFNGYMNNPPLPKARERQNDFGGTLGGPVLKGRTFFFFSYEGLRLRLPQTTLTTVPDMSTRQNAVPSMQAYLNAFPLPNGPDNSGSGTAQLNTSYSNPATLDAYSLRVDQKLASKWTVFGRYNDSPSELISRGGLLGNAALSVLEPTRITTQTATAGATWSASSTTVNDLRFNYSRVKAEGKYEMDSFGGAVPLSNAPLPSGYNPSNSLFYLGIFSLTNPYIYSGNAAKNVQHQLNVTDGLSRQEGVHSLKFGVDVRRLNPVVAPATYTQFVGFNSVSSAQSGASAVGLVMSHRDATLLLHNLGAYAQDTWRALSSFSLTYGLRWDVDFAPSSSNGPSIPSVNGYNLLDLSQLAVAPPRRAPFRTRYSNLAPRLGIAYEIRPDASWQTVLRGGFGMFYDLANSETGNVLAGGFPPFGAFSVFFNQQFPFPAVEVTPVSISPTASISNIFTFNPNLRLPRTMEWSVAIEQAAGREQTLALSYVGAAGRSLLQTTQIFNPPTNPSINEAVFVDNTAESSYNALQIQFKRRLSGGLQALASYTWSHSIDDGSAGSFGNGSNLNVPGATNQNRGSSDFDIRRALTAGLTYDIPFRQSNLFSKAILRGWSLQSYILARSAAPVDLSDVNFSQLNGGIFANIRPDVVPGQPLYLYGTNYPGGKAFNPVAFSGPPIDPNTGNPLRQGDLARNYLRGFGALQWDFSVHRDFPIHEGLKLQFRAEMFNTLNHPNFGPPNNQFGQGGFGLSTQILSQSLAGGNLGGGAFSPLYQLGGPRSIQFALKLMF